MTLTPIHPPSTHLLPAACTSCGGEVRCNTGFADLEGTPWKAFVYAQCAQIALGPMEAARRNENEQMAFFRKAGRINY